MDRTRRNELWREGERKGRKVERIERKREMYRYFKEGRGKRILSQNRFMDRNRRNQL